LLNEQGCCVNRPSFRGLSLTTKATLTPVSSSPWRFHLRRKTVLGASSRTLQTSTRSIGPCCPTKPLCQSTSMPRFNQRPMLSASLQGTAPSCRMATTCASMDPCTVTISASTIRNWESPQSKFRFRFSCRRWLLRSDGAMLHLLRVGLEKRNAYFGLQGQYSTTTGTSVGVFATIRF